MQKTLTERNKILESENLKLTEENDALKQEVLRLNLKIQNFKNQNKGIKDSEAQIKKINKMLISELSFIQDEKTLKLEDIPNTSLFFQLVYNQLLVDFLSLYFHLKFVYKFLI